MECSGESLVLIFYVFNIESNTLSDVIVKITSLVFRDSP